MARLPPSRHPLHCGLRIPDLRARDDSPLNGSCHQGVPAICRTRRLLAQRIRRCGLNAIVGFGADGTADIVARMMGQWLSERLGQQFIIENRPGGGTNLATEAVVRAQPDGYTLLNLTT